VDIYSATTEAKLKPNLQSFSASSVIFEGEERNDGGTFTNEKVPL
jgi:hypothetical protein